MPSALENWIAKPKPTRLTKARAIRLKCLDCCGNQSAEVRKCPATACPLWAYRSGHEQPPPENWGSDPARDEYQNSPQN